MLLIETTFRNERRHNWATRTLHLGNQQHEIRYRSFVRSEAPGSKIGNAVWPIRKVTTAAKTF